MWRWSAQTSSQLGQQDVFSLNYLLETRSPWEIITAGSDSWWLCVKYRWTERGLTEGFSKVSDVVIMETIISFFLLYSWSRQRVYELGSCDQHHVRCESVGTVLRGRKSCKTLGGCDIFVFLSILELYLWLSRSAPSITLTLSPSALHTSLPHPLSW